MAGNGAATTWGSRSYGLSTVWFQAAWLEQEMAPKTCLQSSCTMLWWDMSTRFERFSFVFFGCLDPTTPLFNSFGPKPFSFQPFSSQAYDHVVVFEICFACRVSECWRWWLGPPSTSRGCRQLSYTDCQVRSGCCGWWCSLFWWPAPGPWWAGPWKAQGAQWAQSWFPA